MYVCSGGVKVAIGETKNESNRCVYVKVEGGVQEFWKA
mgnify:CR=1 FL=1